MLLFFLFFPFASLFHHLLVWMKFQSARVLHNNFQFRLRSMVLSLLLLYLKFRNRLQTAAWRRYVWLRSHIVSEFKFFKLVSPTVVVSIGPWVYVNFIQYQIYLLQYAANAHNQNMCSSLTKLFRVSESAQSDNRYRFAAGEKIEPHKCTP